MLKMEKSITLTGSSMINGVQAEGYSAKINSENPEDITLASFQADKALYKTNRIQCRQDAADFEDTAYELQDELIAEKAAAETATE